MSLVSWLIVPSEQTSVLKRSMQREGTWREFCADLGKHVAGHKMGRAVVPYAAEWQTNEQPRAGAHKMPGARWNIISLDLDKCTEDQFENALAKLDEHRISYHAASTYSYDPDGVTKARLHVPVARPLTMDQVPAAKTKLAAWLGLETDKATAGGYSLFFTPRCPAERLKDAFIITRDLGPLYPELLPETDAPVLGLQKQVKPRIVVQPRARESWPEGVRDAAERHLRQLVDMVTNHRHEHIRERLKGGVSLLAGYGASGLIDLDDTYAQLREAVKYRHTHGRDDHSLEYRLDQLDQFINWGEARPVLPEGYDEDGELEDIELGLKSNDAVTRLTSQLLSQAPEDMFTVEEAGLQLHQFLRQPRGLQRWLGLVEVSVGVGKTYALRKLAQERADRGEYTVILSLDHGLLGQIRRDLEKEGVRVRHLHALQQLSEKTGGPQCAIAEREDVKALTAGGVSLAGSVCPKCRLRPTCPAIKHKQRSLKEYVLLAPYPMARRALAMIADANDSATPPLVVCDEEPPKPEKVCISLSAIEELMEDDYVWRLLRSDQTRSVQALGEFLVDPDRLGEPPLELVEEVAGYHGQLHAPDMTLSDLEQHRGLLDALKDVLQLACGWDTRRQVVPYGETEQHWETEVPNAAWQVLQEDGGFILSATPDYTMYENFPLQVQPLQLRVRDHAPTPRVVMFTSHGSRRWVLEHERVNWDKVEADLMEVFRVIKAPKRLLIGTYKAVSDALKTTHRYLLQGRDVALTHYEVVRGRDDWRDRDAFISLYDPRVPSKNFTESTDSAARALEQFHGRARDPQPRPKPAEHYHFGTVAPRTWWLDKGYGVGDGRAAVQLRPLGRPPTPMSPEAIELLQALVEAQGSRTRACAKLGISLSSMSRYLNAKVGIPPTVVQKLTVGVDSEQMVA